MLPSNLLQGGSSSVLQNGSTKPIQKSSTSGTGSTIAGTTIQPAANLPIYTSSSTSSPAAPAPAPTPTVYYDSQGGSYTSAADAQAADALYTQRNASLSGIRTGAGQSFNDTESYFNNQANPFLNNLRSEQTGINQGYENSALNRLSSIHDLLDNIRQGIQSFGIYLSNRNAGSSGASEAAAKAYAKEGEKGNAQIQGEYALDVRGLKTKQENLDRTSSESGRQLHSIISDNVTRISNDTKMKLEQLNADAQYAGLNPIDVASLRQEIIADGQSKLQDLDSWLTSQMGSITPESQDAAEKVAYGLYTAGTPAPGSYNFSVATPQWSGAPIAPVSSLPIYRPGSKTDQSL